MSELDARELGSDAPSWEKTQYPVAQPSWRSAMKTKQQVGFVGCHRTYTEQSGNHFKMLTIDLKLPTGAIRGVARDANGVLAFKGIPYAAPPTGELRWKPPQDVPAWPGVRDATVYGNPGFGAPIPGLKKLTKTQSEDCLTLNV